jgi:hypothetical protein
MSYPINYPTPQGANVQIFRGGDSGTTAHIYTREWVKPQGASFVWFTLIGAGGGGGSGYDGGAGNQQAGGGGASANVTNFMCPAFLIPDVLQVAIGKGGIGGLYPGFSTPGTNGTGGEATKIFYQQKDGTGYQILIASGGNEGGGAPDPSTPGSGGSANGAETGGPMTAAGFYNSTGGMNGATGVNNISGNGTSFLFGGSGWSNGDNITGYYGYTASNRGGYSQIQPIMQSISGGTVKSPFGAGGNGGSIGAFSGSNGGDGLAIIVTW